MSDPADWIQGYVRQANADLKAWELYEKHPEAISAECHKLLFLQMACEKLCKAYLILGGTPHDTLQNSHGYIAGPLPVIIRQQIIHMRGNLDGMQGVLSHARHLANEIELLNPSITRGGQRPDNCEYPWEVGDRVISPLSWIFHPARLCTAPAGRTFLKLLRGAVDRILDE
jgi:hypothetical protein